MRSLKTAVAGLLAAAALSAATLGPNTSRFHVPFEFEAEGRTMPAGNYEMRMERNITVLKSTDTKEGVFLTPSMTPSDGKGTRVKLIFSEYNGRHFLRKIYEGPASGRMLELPVGKREKSVRQAMAQKQTNEVQSAR